MLQTIAQMVTHMDVSMGRIKVTDRQDALVLLKH